MLRKITALALALMMTLATALPALAQDVAAEARLINIHSTGGDEVALSRTIGGRSIEPRSGQRLVDGNVLGTGMDSYVYMQLDAASLIKMDESSQVQVSEARNLLTLSVQSGRALVEVTDQPEGHVLETRIGNTVMTVRGTSFIAGRREGDYTGAVFVTMLSGYGVLGIAGADGTVTEVYVPAGSMIVTIPDAGPEYVIRQEFELEEMGLFELVEIYVRSEALIAAGVLTIEMYRQLPALIAQRRTGRNVWLGRVNEVAAQAADWQGDLLAAQEIPMLVVQEAAAPEPGRYGLIGVWRGDIFNSAGAGMASLDVFMEGNDVVAVRTNYNLPGMTNQPVPFQIRKVVTHNPATDQFTLNLTDWIHFPAGAGTNVNLIGRMSDCGNIFSGGWVEGGGGTSFQFYRQTIAPVMLRSIEAVAVPRNGGTVIGGGRIGLGVEALLVASPREGWVFTGWYEADNLMHTDPQWSFTVDSDRRLEARFVRSDQ